MLCGGFFIPPNPSELRAPLLSAKTRAYKHRGNFPYLLKCCRSSRQFCPPKVSKIYQKSTTRGTWLQFTASPLRCQRMPLQIHLRGRYHCIKHMYWGFVHFHLQPPIASPWTMNCPSAGKWGTIGICGAIPRPWLKRRIVKAPSSEPRSPKKGTSTSWVALFPRGPCLKMTFCREPQL
jgi:hypothetical protein